MFNSKLALALGVAFVIALAFIFVQPTTTAQGQRSGPGSGIGYINDPVFGPVLPGSYIVELKDSVFSSVDDDPKFANKSNVKASAIPAKNAQVVPALKHEYEVETGAIIYDKVRQYNGTAGSSLAPLKMQNAYVDHVMSHAIRGFTVENVKDISIFASDPDIERVEPQQVAFPETQYLPRGLDRIDSDRAVTTTYKPDNRESKLNIDVAVIDSLVWPHPDLYISQWVDFVPTEYTNTYGDHGTHVAGTVAARDNLGGVVGVAPGARIHSVGVCGSAPTDRCSNLSSAFDWVTANAGTIEIATMSIGTTCGWLCTTASSTSGTAATAITNMVNAGVTFFVSAGNDRINANSKAYCDNAPAICVSSMVDTDGKCGSLGVDIPFTVSGTSYPNTDDSRSAFSNFGSAVDLMAPGSYILSTWPSDVHPGTDRVKNGQFVYDAYPYIGMSVHGYYAVLSGTSMATPHAAGAGALVKLSNPSFTPAQVKSTLQTDAYPQTQACDGFGKGGIASANSVSSEEILYTKNY